MNPLLLPPRLMLRALDDLHTLARVAGRLMEVEGAATERLTRLEALRVWEEVPNAAACAGSISTWTWKM